MRCTCGCRQTAHKAVVCLAATAISTHTGLWLLDLTNRTAPIILETTVHLRPQTTVHLR